MIHEIIYANRERGYDLYEQSTGFPEQYLPEIRRICGSLSSTASAGPRDTALRYSPLDDEYGLFTVLFTQSGGNRHEARAHYIGVSFLADRQDTDLLLRECSTYLPLLTQTALRDLRAGTGSLPLRESAALLQAADGDPEPAMSPPPAEVLEDQMETALWMAAAYTSGHISQGQVLIIPGPDTPPVPDLLSRILPFIPEDNRRRLSFHTDLQAASEGVGCILKFCTASGFLNMKENGFEGGERTPVSHWLNGHLTAYDPAALQAAESLERASGADLTDPSLFDRACRGLPLKKALEKQSGGRDSSDRNRHKKVKDPANMNDMKKTASPGRSPALLITQILLSAGLLAALFLGARWLIRLVPEKGGQYLVISVADIRTLTLCAVCLLSGFLLGLLAAGIVRFLNR